MIMVYGRFMACVAANERPQTNTVFAEFGLIAKHSHECIVPRARAIDNMELSSRLTGKTPEFAS
jgi:hypothetical protein